MIQAMLQSVLLLVQEQYSDALQQLEQLLQQQPGDYTALAQLLTLLRRVGRVEEGEAHLRTAQEHVSRTAGTAGRPVASKQYHQRQALRLTQDILRVLGSMEDAPVGLSHQIYQFWVYCSTQQTFLSTPLYCMLLHNK